MLSPNGRRSVLECVNRVCRSTRDHEVNRIRLTCKRSSVSIDKLGRRTFI